MLPGYPSPSADQRAAEKFMNGCHTKAVLSGVMGFVLGGGMGILFGSLNDHSSLYFPGATTKQKVSISVREMGRQSFSYARNFGTFGLLFAGNECLLEKARAEHDVWNGVTAGCATGAMMGARAGPQAMAVGCGLCAAFSAVIDGFIAH